MVAPVNNMEETCSFTFGCNKKDCSEPFCLRKFKLENLYNKALLTEAQRKHITLDIANDPTDLEAFQKLAEISKGIESFVDNGCNLFIYSSTCGNGKTSWSIKLLESYMQKIWAKCDLSCHALFISVPRFLLAIKANITEPNEYAQEILDNVLDADIVVWDDIAAKIGTEFELNHLLSLIDARITAGKSNIYTSNVAPAALTSAIGDRLASRVANLSMKIQFNGVDRRDFFNNLRAD